MLRFLGSGRTSRELVDEELLDLVLLLLPRGGGGRTTGELRGRIDALLDEQFHDREVSGGGGGVERANRVGVLHAQADREQRAHELGVAVAGGSFDGEDAPALLALFPRGLGRQTGADQLDADLGQRLVVRLRLAEHGRDRRAAFLRSQKIDGAALERRMDARHVALRDRLTELPALRRRACRRGDHRQAESREPGEPRRRVSPSSTPSLHAIGYGALGARAAGDAGPKTWSRTTVQAGAVSSAPVCVMRM